MMATDNSTRQIPLAIIGMACRVPGADTLEEFWRLMIEGRSSISELPPERFERELYYDARRGTRNKTYASRGAVLNEPPAARAALPPALEREADCTHRRLVEVAVEALEHARLDPFDLASRNVGVYVGHTIDSDRGRMAREVVDAEDLAACLQPPPQWSAAMHREFCRQAAEALGPDSSAADAPATGAQLAATTISETLGLDGPALAVNAACASSLEALLLAARSLQLGQTDMAIVGGSSVCSRDWLVLFSQAQSLSAGDSRPFDHKADGLVIGEASVAIVIKTLERARADGNPILAVIPGIGASSDGRGRSLWAPRQEGQVAAMRRAYGRGLDPADTQFIEAHATATQLGDATEVAALASVFGPALPPGAKIPVTSVKANLGHTLEAAGLVGVIKTVLCLERETIPPVINVEKLNPKIDWDEAPLCVPTEAIAWPKPAAGKPRRAGVNAFGIGGLNVHVVLESPTGDVAPSSPPAAARGEDDAIAMIGVGCVLPGANDFDQFRARILSGGRADGKPAAGPRCVAEFRYRWERHRIPPKEIEHADPLQFMLLDAADQAFQLAGYNGKPFDREQTAVVIGTRFGGEFNRRLQLTLSLPKTQQRLRQLLIGKGLSASQADEQVAGFADAWHRRWPVLLDNSGSYSAISLAVRIAKSWNLMGATVAVDSGPTSSLAALHAAANLLLSGDSSLVVCGAAERDPFASISAGRKGASAPGNTPSVPFSRHGTGCVAGEGAGVVLLKRLSDARRDGDPVRAVLRGVGMAQGHAGHAPSQAVDRGLQDARKSPAELSLVVCDACGDALTDELLLRAILDSKAVAGSERALPIRSVVEHFGHLGGASGAASLLAAIVALEQGIAPPADGDHPLLGLAVRNRQRVQCRGASDPLAAGSSPAAATVISHDAGQAYCAVLEQASASDARPSEVAAPADEVSGKPATASPTRSGAPTNRTAANGQALTPPVADDHGSPVAHAATNGEAHSPAAANIATLLIEELTALTGYPPEVVDLDADLQADLSIRPDETLVLVRQVQQKLKRTVCEPATSASWQKLRDVVAFLETPSQTSPATGHTPSGNGRHGPKPKVARRSRLEIVDAPRAPGPAAGFVPHGASIVLGDHPVADALRERLEAAGGVAHVIRTGDSVDAVLAAMDELLAGTAVRHLFVLTGLDPAGQGPWDASAWQARRALGLELPVLVVQKWRQRLAQERIAPPITIAAATMLGGKLGLAGAVPAPEGAWIAGFLKSVNIELARHAQPATIKVCDFAPEDRPQAIADALLAELAAKQPEVEIALAGGKRRVLRAVPQAVASLPQTTIERGTTWVITGGARGITAEAAIKLGREHGLKLQIIGRSPAPEPDAPWRNCTSDELKNVKRSVVRTAIAEGKLPETQWDRIKADIEIDSNLRRMRQLGLDVHYHACDLADWPALGRVLETIRRESGPIAGIVHGAGYARSSRLETLKREYLARTLDAKVSGALGLMLLAREDPLRYFIGFGSISGRFGGNGLSDYAAANAMLAALCAWYRSARPDCATTCMDWQSWDEVGMAMLPDSSVGTRGVLKMKFIPPAEGVEHLANELAAGLPEREVLFDDGEFERLIWTE